MSELDVSSLPAWKKALRDRKRRQEATEIAREENNHVAMGPGTAVVTTVPHVSSMGPPWKQTALAKKLQKYGAPSVTVSSTETDKKDVTGSREEMNANAAPERELVVVQVPEVKITSTGSASGEDVAVEERLLPIGQNPILVSDRQKRKHRNHAHLDKRLQTRSDTHSLTTKSTGSKESAASATSDCNATPDVMCPHHVPEEAPDEVFEEEVAYGKGFVHKLLQKFINLSGKDEQPQAVGTTKAQGWVRSTGEGPKNQTKSGDRHSVSDKETSENNSRLNVCRTDESSQQRRDITHPSMVDSGTVLAGKTLQDMRKKDSTVEVSEKPLESDQGLRINQANFDVPGSLQNIVSAARGIFENPKSESHFKKKRSVTSRSLERPSASDKFSVDRPNPDKSIADQPSADRPTVKRLAPERPNYEQHISIKSTDISKTEDGPSNLDSQTGTVLTSNESAEKFPPSALTNKGLFSIGGLKKPAMKQIYSNVAKQTVDIKQQQEVTQSQPAFSVDVNENVKNEQIGRLTVPQTQTGSQSPVYAGSVNNSPLVTKRESKTVAGILAGITKPDEEKGVKVANAITSSAVGQHSIKSSSKVYGALGETDMKFVDGNRVDQKGAKVNVTSTDANGMAIVGSRVAEAGYQLRPTIGSPADSKETKTDEATNVTGHMSVATLTNDAETRFPNVDLGQTETNVQQKTAVTLKDSESIRVVNQLENPRFAVAGNVETSSKKKKVPTATLR